jgi:hypothetical protein
MGVGSFTTVIVPRSAFEAARDPQQAHNLVQAVAKFVHTMMGQGLYTRDELLPKATHAFLAGYYLSQVNHGGHREFIHNNFVNIDLSLSDLRAALAAIGTEPYRSIAERLIAWCGERRDPVTHKIDLSNRGQSDFLGDLDREFTAADKASPLNNLLAGWIAAWPELRVVDDADYPEALRLSVTMNPLRALRQQWRSVRRLQFQTTDRFQVAVGLACLKMQRVEIRQDIGPGFGVEIDGRNETGFTVRTHTGQIRLCVVKPDYAAAYEYVPPDIPEVPKGHTDPKAFLAAVRESWTKDIIPPRAGAELSRVSGLMIDDAVSLAKAHRAGLAIDLLLRRAGIETAGAEAVAMKITPNASGDRVGWMLKAADQPYVAETAPEGAVLLPPESMQPLAMVGARDLNDHADHIAAGSMEAMPR